MEGLQNNSEFKEFSQNLSSKEVKDTLTKSSNNNLNTLLQDNKSTTTINTNNNDFAGNVNVNVQKDNKNSDNPFVETFNQMQSTPNNGTDIFKFLQNFQSGNGDNGGETANVGGLYDILGKLSDEQTQNLNESDKAKHLYALFENLLDYLLKSDMLAEPLQQIKTSVESYINKNKEKLKTEELNKYEQLLSYVNTILGEIGKGSPDKALIIDIFYKLHELSDFDDDIMGQVNPYLKDFSEMFGSSFKK